ncbi:MAG: MBL fold metallo-hydrolase [Paracoccus sp. (in: a-proteobacteria)]|nr:MBL fold metallo-hydrolase [Paracoccus sp. (in: a-proteobacteria)]
MLRMILAPNPSPLTGPGTNSFLLGRESVAVIDPGPDLPAHVDALIAAGDGRISHIFVTHAHLDHSAAAPALARASGAPVIGFGTAETGRSAVMAGLATSARGGEGVDHGFSPDIVMRDGDEIVTAEWSLRAVHTQGHMGNHLSFLWGDTLFCGDIVLGWASTLISPPDGDLIDYMRSLDRIEALAPARLRPAHGDMIDNPAARLTELRAHRRDRGTQILRALYDGPADAATLARRIYDDIPPALLPAAARNVLAHLIAMNELGITVTRGQISAESRFELA